MENFISVIDFYFDVLRQVFDLLTSNWFFGFILLIMVFSLIVTLMGVTRGQK